MKVKRVQKIRNKIARRWLARNHWRIAKMELGIGSAKRSCFGKQLKLCRKVLNIREAY